MSEVGTFQLIKQGNLRVEIHFAEALVETINVVLYAEFDNVIEIIATQCFPQGSKVRLIVWVICFWHRPP
jgi:hypothetical protein